MAVDEMFDFIMQAAILKAVKMIFSSPEFCSEVSL